MSSFADHFSRLAPAYAGNRPHYPDSLFDYLASVCGRHRLAWDCAAGTGQASIPLADRFDRVVATDASRAMLSQAPAHPRVEYLVAPAEASGIASSSADLVTVAQALHWLDSTRFYHEADRVLTPGGILAVWTYGLLATDDSGLDQLLAEFYTEVVGPYWSPERRHVDAGYRTLSFPYPELTAPAFSMEQRWTPAELLGYIGTWSATQRYRELNHRDPVEELAIRLRPLWGDPGGVRSIRWPLSVRLGAKPT